jgi:uncharacterized metal-binding protein
MTASTTPNSAGQTSRRIPCVLACSGCSPAGALADRTARRLQELGLAQMSCLVGVGGRVKPILATVQSAPGVMVIDGCPLECGANSLRHAGITSFIQFRLDEAGVRKHDSAVLENDSERVIAAAAQQLANAGFSSRRSEALALEQQA